MILMISLKFFRGWRGCKYWRWISRVGWIIYVVWNVNVSLCSGFFHRAMESTPAKTSMWGSQLHFFKSLDCSCKIKPALLKIYFCCSTSLGFCQSRRLVGCTGCERCACFCLWSVGNRASSQKSWRGKEKVGSLFCCCCKAGLSEPVQGLYLLGPKDTIREAERFCLSVFIYFNE